MCPRRALHSARSCTAEVLVNCLAPSATGYTHLGPPSERVATNPEHEDEPNNEEADDVETRRWRDHQADGEDDCWVQEVQPRLWVSAAVEPEGERRDSPDEQHPELRVVDASLVEQTSRSDEAPGCQHKQRQQLLGFGLTRSQSQKSASWHSHTSGAEIGRPRTDPGWWQTSIP